MQSLNENEPYLKTKQSDEIYNKDFEVREKK
jgi:hypothetical protein